MHIAPVSAEQLARAGSGPYLYRPIAHYAGRVLKCCGMATPASREIVQAKADGLDKWEDPTLLANGVVVELPIYAGDRITADTFENVEGS